MSRAYLPVDNERTFGEALAERVAELERQLTSARRSRRAVALSRDQWKRKARQRA